MDPADCATRARGTFEDAGGQVRRSVQDRAEVGVPVLRPLRYTNTGCTRGPRLPSPMQRGAAQFPEASTRCSRRPAHSAEVPRCSPMGRRRWPRGATAADRPTTAAVTAASTPTMLTTVPTRAALACRQA